MARVYTQDEILFIQLYTELLESDLKEFGSEKWVELHGDKTPAQVADEMPHTRYDLFQAFRMGLGAKVLPVPDAGPWQVSVDKLNPRKIGLQSDDFFADVAVYAEITGDFGATASKLMYARRLCRLMNEVSLLDKIPQDASDKVMGYVRVDNVAGGQDKKEKQFVRAFWMPDLPEGRYAIYAVPVEVSPPMSVNQDLLMAASSVLEWSRFLFSDRARKRWFSRYQLFDSIPTPQEFKTLAEAVQRAKG